MVGCSVLGCKSRSEQKIYGLTFHSFPTNNKMNMTRWLNATGRQNWTPTKYSKICSIHFEVNSFDYKKKNVILKQNSVPVQHIHFMKSTGLRTLEDSLPSTSAMDIDHSRDPGNLLSMVPNFESRTETSGLESQGEEQSKMNEMINIKTEICESEDCPPELEEITFEPLKERKRELYLTIKPPEPSSSKIARIEQVCSLVNEAKTSPNPTRNQEERTNEFDIFGTYVAAQLKYLNEEDAILAQDEIQSILTRYKLKKIRQKNNNFMQSSNAYTPRSYTSDSDPNDNFELRKETSDLESQDEEESKMNEMINIKTEIRESEDCPPELEEITFEPLKERKRELYLTIKPPEPSSSKIARIEQVCSLVNEAKTSPNPTRIQEERTNEFDIFGTYVAAQLKYLNEEDAILAHDEIQSILTRYKLKTNRQKNNNFMQSSNAYYTTP